MAERSDIFAKQRLTVGQLRAVADRRFGDAEALVETGDNARANGAQYLAGIVIEILLKGQLLQLHPELSNLESGSIDDKRVWNLIWRSHSLTDMLDRLPVVRSTVQAKGDRASQPYIKWPVSICSEWSIHARYSPASSNIATAKQMIERVRILKEVLK